MGLRINTNWPAELTLLNLRRAEKYQEKSLERLSTGLKLNRASDDPTGLSVSSILRARVQSLEIAVENTKSAGNVVSVADGGLGQITELLHEIQRSIVFALNTPSPSEKQAEQASVDRAIEAIRRIAKTTRFGDLQLLDGSKSIAVENVSASAILEIKPYSARFDPAGTTTQFSLEVLQVARQAIALAGSSSSLTSLAADGGDVVLQVTGPLGTEEIKLPANATSQDLSSAINSLRGFLGVYASGGYLYTENFGANAILRIEQVGGSGIFRGGDISTPGLSGVGKVYFTTGTNASALFEGARVSGDGNLLTIYHPSFTGNILLNPATNQDPLRGPGSTGNFTFSLRESGILFQLGPQSQPTHQEILGIPSLEPEFLGSPEIILGGIKSGGFLSSIMTGGENDLFANPQRGLAIVNSALDYVLDVRSYLGSFMANVVEPTQSAQEVAIENLSSAVSTIRDADFAEESAIYTRNQVLFQAGISLLAQANQFPQMVLELLAR
jgi:flagellin